MNEIKIGDVVKLKSGGPKMTVQEFIEHEDHPKDCYCQWFDAANHLKNGNFTIDSLVLVEALQESK